MAFVTIPAGTTLYRGAIGDVEPYGNREDCDIIYFARNKETAEKYAKDYKSKGFIWEYETLKDITLLCLYDKEREFFNNIVLNVLKKQLHKYIDEIREKERKSTPYDGDDSLSTVNANNNIICKDADLEGIPTSMLVNAAKGFGLDSTNMTGRFVRHSEVIYDSIFLSLMFRHNVGMQVRKDLKHFLHKIATCKLDASLVPGKENELLKIQEVAGQQKSLCDEYIGYIAFEWPTGKMIDDKPQVFHEELCLQKKPGLLRLVQKHNGGSKRSKAKQKKMKGGDDGESNSCPVLPVVRKTEYDPARYFNRDVTSVNNVSNVNVVYENVPLLNTDESPKQVVDKLVRELRL